MKTMFRTALGLGVVAMLAGAPAAHAQGRGFGYGGGGGITMVISNSGVQKELKLDDAQIEKAKELATSTREKMTEMREKLQGLEQDERRTKMTELMRDINATSLKSAAEFLKPEQLTRAKQISYQLRGAMAFSDPEISKKLSITDSQKEEIQTIVTESRGEMPSREDYQNDREAAMKKMQEINKETLAKATAKLNDEQKKSWNELIGAPYTFKADPPPQ
jgi:K+/H+ antiporter YhaU regulatory subunit KhtT